MALKKGLLGPHTAANINFCSKIKFSIIPFLARKFKFTVGVDFIKIELLDKNWDFASVCLLLLGSNLVCVLPTFTFPSLSSRDLKTCFKPFRHTHWPSKSTTAQWAKKLTKNCVIFWNFQNMKKYKKYFYANSRYKNFHQKCLKFAILFLEFETWQQKCNFEKQEHSGQKWPKILSFFSNFQNMKK